MTWSYDATLLGAKPLYQVRFLTGDTLSGDQQMTDEEIAFVLTQRSSIYGAAAMCCRSLSAQKARLADVSTGDLRTTYSSLSQAYSKRAGEYEAQATARSGALPYAGGVTVTDKQNQEADGDRVQPQFKIGQEDNFLPVSPIDSQNTDGSGNR